VLVDVPDHVAELRAKLAAAEVPGEVTAVVDRDEHQQHAAPIAGALR
jgi:hypothetical protein